MQPKYSEEFKVQVVFDYTAGRMFVNYNRTEYAKLHNISPRTLGRWLDKYAPIDNDATDTSRAWPVIVQPLTKTTEEDIWRSIDEPIKQEEEEAPTISYVGSSLSITLYRGEDMVTVHCADDRFPTVMSSIIAGDLEDAWEESNYKHILSKWNVGSISVEDGLVYVSGFPVNNRMTDKLLSMIEEDDKGAERFALFFESLMEVQDKRVVDELYNFLQHNDIKLNADGTFTGYKAVRQDYKDKYTGNIDNSVGKYVKMPRNLVDDDKDKTCSAGLHVGSLTYASRTYGNILTDKIVMVSVKPSDVVSVPTDYNGQKLRACAYTVVADITQELIDEEM